MILLVTPIQRAQECAARIHQLTGEPVVTAQNLTAALPHLRVSAPTAVIFDHHLVEAEPLERTTALAHIGDAIFLEINFAQTGIDRLSREVEAALEQRERNQSSARAAAVRSLHRDLNETLTTLLLNCNLVSETLNVPPTCIEKLSVVREAAQKLHKHLETTALVHG